MKKLVLFVLLVAMISLSGCGQKSNTVSITGPGGEKASMTVK